MRANVKVKLSRACVEPLAMGAFPAGLAAVCGCLLMIGLAEPALAGPITIADFQSGYVAGTTDGATRAATQADGWNYLCNSAGVIGTSANYTGLGWDTANNAYVNGTDYYPFVGYHPVLYTITMHPGEGTSEGSAVDRFFIAAYTIQPGEGGQVTIADSSIEDYGILSNGVQLCVYVNDALKTNFIQAGGAVAGSFNGSLGDLSAGDTVYVAVGPNGSYPYDTSRISFALTIPEPATLALLAIGGGLALIRRRRRN